jgi:hypothetical protein
MRRTRQPGGQRQVTAGNGRQGWKPLLALISLALSGLLWLNGLAESLSRPSVGGDVNLRQLELASLARQELPPGLGPLLAGADPDRALQQALADSLNSSAEAGRRPAADLRLELALLQRRRGDLNASRSLLQELLNDADDPAAARYGQPQAKPGPTSARSCSSGSVKPPNRTAERSAAVAPP